METPQFSPAKHKMFAPKTVSVALTQAMLRHLDALATTHKVTRSDVIRTLLTQALTYNATPEEPQP